MMEKITDKEAVQILTATKYGNANVADVFVKETVVYPVVIYYTKDVPTTEIRAFVCAGSYCSKRQAEKAAEYKKEYPELNKQYASSLKSAKIPVTAKEYPLRATPMV